MADGTLSLPLSGNAVHGAVSPSLAIPPEITPEAVIPHQQNLEETIRQAVSLIHEALDLTSNAVTTVVDAASDRAFESAASIGANIATPAASQTAQSTFSWGGYFQAIGLLCLLLAVLWFAVWLIRRYGRFNFLPKPGSLPRDALLMEAQMPLGPRKGLMVVKFMGRRLLLGVTEHQITLLTEEKLPDDRQNKNFQSYLSSGAAYNGSPDSEA